MRRRLIFNILSIGTLSLLTACDLFDQRPELKKRNPANTVIGQPEVEGPNSPKPGEPPTEPTDFQIRGQNPKTGDRFFIGNTFLLIFGAEVAPLLAETIYLQTGYLGGATDMYEASIKDDGELEFPVQSAILPSFFMGHIPQAVLPANIIGEGLITNTCLRLFQEYKARVDSVYEQYSIDTTQSLERDKLNTLYQLFFPMDSITDEQWSLFQDIETELGNSSLAWDQSFFIMCSSGYWKIH
jgi:hypothetical protein